MQLVKQLRVDKMHCDHHPDVYALILCGIDPYREDKGVYPLNRETACACAIPFDSSLMHRDIEFTFAHRMLVGERIVMQKPQAPADFEEWLDYSREVDALGENTLLLDKVVQHEEWTWHPYAGHPPKELLLHQSKYFLKALVWSALENSPSENCLLTVELTPEEYEECTKLLPGSVFDITLRLVPASDAVT